MSTRYLPARSVGLNPRSTPAAEFCHRGGQSVLEAVLERITYANEDTGHTVAGQAATGRHALSQRSVRRHR
jgi:hypothetical protein